MCSAAKAEKEKQVKWIIEPRCRKDSSCWRVKGAEVVKTFKKMRGIKLSYEKQGIIYFTLQNICEQPQEIRNKVKALCNELAGPDSRALYLFLTSRADTAQSISLKYYIAERKLYQLRKAFYMEWEKLSREKKRENR